MMSIGSILIMTILILILKFYVGLEMDMLKGIIALCIFSGIGSLSFLSFIPKEVVLEKDGIAIKRTIKTKFITSYEDIKEVLLIENSKEIDYFNGNDVIYYGLGSLLKNKDIDEMGKFKNVVLIKADENYLLGIKNPQEFITDLENMIRR